MRRSLGGNQWAASFVMAPRMRGCPTAMPICDTNTSVKLSANSPRVTAKTAWMAAPSETAPAETPRVDEPRRRKEEENVDTHEDHGEQADGDVACRVELHCVARDRGECDPECLVDCPDEHEGHEKRPTVSVGPDRNVSHPCTAFPLPYQRGAGPGKASCGLCGAPMHRGHHHDREHEEHDADGQV